ncbi:MAG TPA: hypothetical protein VL983_09040 [Terriglobales bacterium]|nr:hypothetical protein [Terriglobales bacterium]
MHAPGAQVLNKSKLIFGLLALTAAALFIHGYHPYAEDSEIYLPGVLKLLNPSLFPVNAEFFGEHAGHSLYPNLIAASVRLSHLPLPWVMFLWHIASIFLMLAGTWRLASAFFPDPKPADAGSNDSKADNLRARWAAVTLMAALLTLPLAGTWLFLLDQYLNPRNLAAFAGIFAIAETLHKRYIIALLWLVFAAACHPFMAAFSILFCTWLVLLDRFQPRIFGFAAILPFGVTFDLPPAAYHEVALRQRSHYILRWEWYEWLGAIAPILLFWWFARIARRRGLKNVELASRAIIPVVVVAIISAIILSSSPQFEALARLQPLRSLAITYSLLIVIGGGFLGEYVLKAHIWRWLVLFIPLSLLMFSVQRQVFPASAHIEWPWAKPLNPWAQAFDWIRLHTPVDALFALNPAHMDLPGEDEIGFRARAERSMLADLVKDKGASTMFPPLSVEWLKQIEDQRNWTQFQSSDFERLRQKYGVNWVVVQQPGPSGLDCPYQNAVVRVCRLEPS